MHPVPWRLETAVLFQMGGIYLGRKFSESSTASDLSDQLRFLDMDSSRSITMHIQSALTRTRPSKPSSTPSPNSIDQRSRSRKSRPRWIRHGRAPSDLATYGRDAKALLKELQSQNERMFLVTFLVLNTGKTGQELETNVFQAVSIAQKHKLRIMPP